MKTLPTPALRTLALSATLSLAWLAATPAHAGRTCEQRAPQAVNVERAMTLAANTAAALDASGAEVVVLARRGQNLDKYGLRYSHFGLVYKDGSGPDARWRVAHKLNQCGTALASVYRQGLGEFFLDDLYQYEAAYVVPTPEVQRKLLATLRDNRQLARLNTPAYSMLAYPWAQRYQQSNQWALETMALSQDPAVTSRERAQAWLQLQGYEPTALNIPALTRLGGRVTRANIAFDDHPNSKRFSDRIETVTVDSVFSWLDRSGLGGAVKVVR